MWLSQETIMAISSRRTIQRMLNENAAFLSEKQLEKHVSALNRNNFQSLDAEWEVAVLNAFSKIGTVIHELELPDTTKNLDLLFTPLNDSTACFVADVTTVSDEGLEMNTPVRTFAAELSERIKKAGLERRFFNYAIGAFPRKSPDDKVRLMLPKRGEFLTEIFNSAFTAFLKEIKRNPDEARRCPILTAKTNVLIAYNPKQTGSGYSYLSYTQAWSKTQNPVYNALKQKAQGQFKEITYAGPKGIIICDGGCGLFSTSANNPAIGDFVYNAGDIAKDFLRQNESIAFVLLVSSIWNETYRWPAREGWSHRIQVKLLCNSSFHLLPPAIRSNLLEVEKHFPPPINIASGARENIRHRFNSKRASANNITGVCEMGATRIKVSTRDVLRVLAGEVNPDELFDFGDRNANQNQGFNYFKQLFDKRFRIASVSLEETPYDDDYLVLEFDGPDPALSPFINLKTKPDK
jgi:hypothetical protein